MNYEGILGFGLMALFLCITSAAVVIYVSGTITRHKIEEKLREKNIYSAMIQEIDRCKNCISLKDLDSGKILQIQGDGVSDDLYNEDRIYVQSN